MITARLATYLLLNLFLAAPLEAITASKPAPDPSHALAVRECATNNVSTSVSTILRALMRCQCLPDAKRYYHFTITRNYHSPDGVNSSLILVNGAYPGPTIEANLSDTFVIRAENNITCPESGTALHWHGLFHRENPWMDGVPSVTMCPIAPGSSFTYTFKADRAGTSWWHSHYSSQLSGGLFGAMIIHDKSSQTHDDIDLGPVLLSDFYHNDYRDLINRTLHAELVYSNNNMINGKMNYNCTSMTDGKRCTPNAPLSKFVFKSGKRHLLRLINSGTEALQHFRIDGHVFEMIALDFRAD